MPDPQLTLLSISVQEALNDIVHRSQAHRLILTVFKAIIWIGVMTLKVSSGVSQS